MEYVYNDPTDSFVMTNKSLWVIPHGFTILF